LHFVVESAFVDYPYQVIICIYTLNGLRNVEAFIILFRRCKIIEMLHQTMASLKMGEL